MMDLELSALKGRAGLGWMSAIVRFCPESSRRRVMATFKFTGGVPEFKDKLIIGTVKRG